MLDKALKSGERIMETVVTQFQMNMDSMDWIEIRAWLCRMDDTELGRASLLPDKPKAAKLDTLDAVTESNKCSHCGKKGHGPDKC